MIIFQIIILILQFILYLILIASSYSITFHFVPILALFIIQFELDLISTRLLTNFPIIFKYFKLS
jgi:hypothetical protein